MRLAWATDVHLDFLDPGAIAAFGRSLAATEADAVLLTGDLSVARRLGPDLARLVDACRRPVYYVAGNHDYYGADVATVRRAMRALREVEPRLRWLPAEGVVRLTPDVALVGVDGWADGRLGNPETTPVVFNDHRLIADLRHTSRAELLAASRRLGDAEAQALRRLLGEALAPCRRVLVATHVPPFAEASAYQGVPTGPDWLPWMVCHAVGEVLRELARAHPDRDITVLAGHTHERREVQIEPNLTVKVGRAVYREPSLEAVLEL